MDKDELMYLGLLVVFASIIVLLCAGLVYSSPSLIVSAFCMSVLFVLGVKYG